jgi:hypothetical protein
MALAKNMRFMLFLLDRGVSDVGHTLEMQAGYGLRAAPNGYWKRPFLQPAPRSPCL